MSDVFVVETVFAFVSVRSMSYRVGAMHIGLIGYSVHDLFLDDRQRCVVVLLLVDLLLFRCLKSRGRSFPLLGSNKMVVSHLIGFGELLGTSH